MNCADRRRLACFFVIALVIAASMPARVWAADDLAIAKIALHLVPGTPGPNACAYIPPSNCIDLYGRAVFSVGGEIDQDYHLYVIAVDINSSAGLASASFAIEYDQGVVVDGWRSCADNPTYSPDWPASGSHVGLGFTTCMGTEPAAQDPEGDGAAVLGVFHVRAHSVGRLAIGTLDTSTRTAEVRSCEGVTTMLSWQSGSPDPVGNVALGEVGFGELMPPYSACEFPGIVDNDCMEGWTDVTLGCCIPNVGCAPATGWASPRACARVDGEWRLLPCRMTYHDADCLATPVQPSTWGMIKARY
jgi:hypothetical protein